MMRVFRTLQEIVPEARNCALSIGNFDGVHAGHRRLLQRDLELARLHGLIPSVLTFDPHPTRVVAPQRAPRLLTTLEQRLELMQREGIAQVFVLPFDRTFSELSPADFIDRVLVGSIGASLVLVGDNFRFGHKQEGTVETLKASSSFATEVVPAVTVRGRVVSSTEVRTLLESGDVSRAARLLLRSYALEGTVVPGFGIGSKQTVPTLNLDTRAEVIPARGVYVTRTADTGNGRQWPSVTNVGTRPTFDGQAQTIETFLLSALEGEAPRNIRVNFLRRVRDERRFDSPELLRAQILKDVARAQAYHRRTRVLDAAC
ncbi:MAG TPA: bifunctional riboflavin kinase/FAD synthetase [Bryobacteraceae bacterium]|nr:bifunctional riboflavin kinase/FAD synthetase [Bryobacteraceae bacterium]